MKTRIITLAFILLAAVNILNAEPRMDIDVNFGFFYQNLSPHGTWLQIDAGIYGWRPNRVSANWRPYSLGRWNWTEYGWYWDSYEPFGWATYHYGRWINDEYYGWIWVPDYEWGPSWVEWRYDDDYIGWAPLPPYAGFRFGFGINFSFDWHSHYNYWNFVRFDHFCNNRVNNYFIDDYHVNRIFDKTRYRTNYYDRDNRIINGGVDRDFVERRSGGRIRETSIRTTSDLRDMARNGNERNSYIRAFRPGDDDLRKTRDIEIKNVTRPERNISIERDRIAIRTSRDNNPTVQRSPEYTPERTITRTERNNSGNMNREKDIIRNERPTNTNNDRNVIRNEKQVSGNNAIVIERERQNNERAIQRKEEAVREKPVVRENNRQGNANRGFEMNRNRSEQKIEKPAERKVTSENKSSERNKVRSTPPERSNNNGSRERKR